MPAWDDCREEYLIEVPKGVIWIEQVLISLAVLVKRAVTGAERLVSHHTSCNGNGMRTAR
jgi:hypothetical protein